MSLQLNNTENVIKDLVSHIQDPDFCDVKIICSDGEIPANKSILGLRSQYFCSMFSSSNNFVESQAGCVKLPYTKAVVEKVVLYLYSGEMTCDDLALGQMLDLLELLNSMNLPEEFSSLEDFTMDTIWSYEKFSLSVCLDNFEKSYKLGLEVLGDCLLEFLAENFFGLSEMAEVGGLSEAMIMRLLRQKREVRSQTILRFQTFAKWL